MQGPAGLSSTMQIRPTQTAWEEELHSSCSSNIKVFSPCKVLLLVNLALGFYHLFLCKENTLAKFFRERKRKNMVKKYCESFFLAAIHSATIPHLDLKIS